MKILPISYCNSSLKHQAPAKVVRCGIKENKMWCSWSPRSLDLTQCSVFLRAYMKCTVFVLTLPTDIPHLKHRITEAVVSVTGHMLIKVLGRNGYHVFHVTHGAHMEYLVKCIKNLRILHQSVLH